LDLERGNPPGSEEKKEDRGCPPLSLISQVKRNPGRPHTPYKVFHFVGLGSKEDDPLVHPDDFAPGSG
jgi:hypothetical protein